MMKQSKRSCFGETVLKNAMGRKSGCPILSLRFCHTRMQAVVVGEVIACLQLAESLILSKLDCTTTVFYPLPECQQKRLQRVQNVCAGYVLGRYAREADCLQLGWLPLIERRSYQLLQCVFKALHFDY